MRHAAMLLAMVTACGGGGSGGGPSLEDLPQAAHDAECAYSVRCGLFASTADCDAYFRISINPSPQAAVDAGKTHYDPGAAARCFDSLAGASCDATTQSAREIDDACNHILTGTGQMGDACVDSAECASANCANVTGTGDCRQGTCGPAQVIAKSGESCAVHQCEPGLFCDASETCVALEVQNTPCDFDSDCNYGLGCLGATAKTCQPVPHIGDACPDDECAEINATCNAAGSCVAVGLPGDPCMNDIDCTGYGECDTTAMKCTNFPSLGMACLSVCVGDAYCDLTAMSCVAPLTDGALCTNDGECESQFCDAAGACAERMVCI